MHRGIITRRSGTKKKLGFFKTKKPEFSSKQTSFDLMRNPVFLRTQPKAAREQLVQKATNPFVGELSLNTKPQLGLQRFVGFHMHH
jgi:hypothetical protein